MNTSSLLHVHVKSPLQKRLKRIIPFPDQLAGLPSEAQLETEQTIKRIGFVKGITDPPKIISMSSHFMGILYHPPLDRVVRHLLAHLIPAGSVQIPSMAIRVDGDGGSQQFAFISCHI